MPIHLFHRFNAHRRATILAVASVSLILCAPLSLRRGVPLPQVHDEFSYLLAADTYARGRVTNPTHPMWEHFESMHIIVRPTYVSKYPPGQAVTLALGQVLTGKPIWGVWLATAGACAAICWMLTAFVPPRWALLGGLLVASHPQVLAWSQCYWGGNLAMLGGALVVGGFQRLKRRAGSGRWNTFWLAAGLLLLANTRPFEGLVLTAAVLMGNLAGSCRMLARNGILLPLLAVLLPGALLMAYSNWRVTGSPWRVPYQEHQAQYATVPLFWFFPLREPRPDYGHRELERFYGDVQARWYKRMDAWTEVKRFNGPRLDLYEGSLGLAGISILILPWLVWKTQRARLVVLVLVMFCLGLLLETFFFPHYGAPAAGVLAAITLMALRRLARVGRPAGAIFVALVVSTFWLSSACWWWDFFNSSQTGFPVSRQQVLTDLAGRPGKHLVVVRYGEGHNVHQEWVYNEADIDAAKVVWAREMDRERNHRLLDFFSHRTAWLLEPDVNPTALRPYTP